MFCQRVGMRGKGSLWKNSRSISATGFINLSTERSLALHHRFTFARNRKRSRQPLYHRQSVYDYHQREL